MPIGIPDHSCAWPDYAVRERSLAEAPMGAPGGIDKFALPGARRWPSARAPLDIHVWRGAQSAL
jgi:hypothetical protein